MSSTEYLIENDMYTCHERSICIFKYLSLLIASCSYLGYGLYSLFSTNVWLSNNKCSLWYYVLASILFNFVHGIYTYLTLKKINTIYKRIIHSFFPFLAYGIFTIWGVIELFIFSCEELYDSILWRFGLFSVIIELFLSIVFLSCFVSLCCKHF